MVNEQEHTQFDERLLVLDHPLVNHKLALLRDKGTPSRIFRETLSEIAMLEAYEATRDLRTHKVEVETPITTTSCEVITGEEPVLVPILRAGLAMEDAFMTMIPNAPVAHLGMHRDEGTHEPTVYYSKTPTFIADRQVLLLDPMLATGGSLLAAIQVLREHGVKDLKCIVIVAAPEGVSRVLEADPDVSIVAAALDDGLNDDAYIVPGLGDAGDRIFQTFDTLD